MPKPGKVWTLAQAIVWAASASGIATDAERDVLIDKCDPMSGEEKTGPFGPFVALAYARNWQSAKEASEVTRLSGPYGDVSFTGQRINEAWKAAWSSLEDEIRRGQIDVLGIPLNGNNEMVRLTRLECTALVFGEVADDVCARAAGDLDWRWRGIRFEADQIVDRWPPRSVDPSPDKPDALSSARHSTPQLEDTKGALRKLFPGKRPRNRSVIRSAVEKELGRDVSLSTIDRAIREIWRPG